MKIFVTSGDPVIFPGDVRDEHIAPSGFGRTIRSSKDRHDAIPGVTEPAIATPHPATKYRPDIDGVRAIAVLSVVLFHLKASWLPGGFVGVDIFFVISGYLITLIITKSAEPVMVAKFYANRVRRIMPALLVMLATVLAISCVILLPLALSASSIDVISGSFAVSNVRFWNSIDYFNSSAQLRPTLHTWSLGVEWQFYIVYPIVMNAAQRLRIGVRPLLLVLTALSVAASIWQSEVSPQAAYYLPVSRAYEMLIGGLAAVGIFDFARSERISRWLGPIALLAIGASIALIDEDIPFPGWVALIPCTATAVLICAGTTGGLVARLLSTPLLVFIGRISYSIYLWHWPVISFARYLAIRDLTDGELAGCGIAAIGLGYLSWRFIEETFRHNRSIASRTIGTALTVAAMLSASAGAVVIARGLPGRFAAPISAMEAQSGDKGRFMRCLELAAPVAGRSDGQCRLGVTDRPPTFMIWGDSKGGAAAAGIADVAARRDRSGLFVGTHSCLPLFGQTGTWAGARDRCRSINRGMKTTLMRSRIDKIVLIGRWAALPAREFGQIRDTLAWLADHHITMTILLDVPGAQQSVPSGLARQLAYGRRTAFALTPADVAERDGAVDAALRAAATRYGATIIDPARVFCKHAVCEIAIDGRPLYSDKGHLNDLGSGVLARAAANDIFPAAAELHHR